MHRLLVRIDEQRRTAIFAKLGREEIGKLQDFADFAFLENSFNFFARRGLANFVLIVVLASEQRPHHAVHDFILPALRESDAVFVDTFLADVGDNRAQMSGVGFQCVFKEPNGRAQGKRSHPPVGFAAIVKVGVGQAALERSTWH